MSDEPPVLFWEWLTCCWTRSEKSCRVNCGDDEKRTSDYSHEKSRPTHFISFRVDSPEIRDEVARVQNDLVQRKPESKSAIISLDQLHLTILLTKLDGPEEVEIFRACLRKAAVRLRGIFADGVARSIAFHNVGSFGQKVLYCEPTEPSYELLSIIRTAIVDEVVQANLPYLEEKAWLLPGQTPRGTPFRPHLTMAKVSKVHDRKRGRKVHLSPSRKCCTVSGAQELTTLDLCAMGSDDKDDLGYYPVIDCALVVPPDGEKTDAIRTHLNESTWAVKSLHVQKNGEVGAVLRPTTVGLLVESVDSAEPTGLQVDDVIVSIDNVSLMGLQKRSSVDRVFGASLRQGAWIEVATKKSIDVQDFPECKKKTSPAKGKPARTKYEKTATGSTAALEGGHEGEAGPGNGDGTLLIEKKRSSGKAKQKSKVGAKETQSASGPVQTKSHDSSEATVVAKEGTETGADDGVFKNTNELLTSKSSMSSTYTLPKQKKSKKTVSRWNSGEQWIAKEGVPSNEVDSTAKKRGTGPDGNGTGSTRRNRREKNQ